MNKVWGVLLPEALDPGERHKQVAHSGLQEPVAPTMKQRLGLREEDARASQISPATLFPGLDLGWVPSSPVLSSVLQQLQACRSVARNNCTFCIRWHTHTKVVLCTSALTRLLVGRGRVLAAEPFWKALAG